MKERVGRYLLNTFRATERLNKTQILRELASVSGGSLLDCGCGDGSFTIELARATEASEVHGIEIDPPRVSAALLAGIQAEVGNLNEELPYEDASFDVVHANQVIEHVVSSDHLLREIHRVLKPSGLAVISTNNLASWHNVISLILGIQPPPAHASSEVVIGNPFDPLRGSAHPTPGDSHLRLLSFRGLRDVCAYHGFEVRRMQSCGYYPLPPNLARWAARLDRRHGAFLIATLAKPDL